MISCSNCNTPNPADHKFCSNCGHPLTVSCPTCGTENEGANKFCFNCGTALRDLTTGAPREVDGTGAPVPTVAERRFVSVLFADLVGYTSFSEGRDAEDVRAMLTDYYDRCRVIIDRYGGRTDKFIGDAVMGVWGAVAAHEDDAERATRAALEIVDMVAGLGSELGIDELAARAGVLSGEASVGPGGNEQGLVVGDLVNTASRLQSIAPPGGVVVGGSTRDLVGGAIEFVAMGDQTVKGKTDPVPAFQAVRVVASSFASRGGELGAGPFVGRDDELRILKDQLHAAERENQARLVSIVGEGGIGKTRLSEEFVRYLEGIAKTIYLHRGRSPSYGDGVTFWALGEMVRQRAGILENEEVAKSRLKLRTVVAEFAPEDEDQRWIEPRLAGLIGLAPMPNDDRSELFMALRAFFLRVAERGPTVMVFEDLHWADEGLLDFVEELVDRTTRHPILVITLARSDLLERRRDWGAARQRTLSMHLGRLDEPTVVRLVTGLAPGIDDALAGHIAARSAGVPLHAVEFVRMLVNEGRLVRDGEGYRFEGAMDDLTVPDSVSAVIGARLDRLGFDEVGVIQDATVLGHAFSLQDLALVRSQSPDELEHVLRDLARREIIELDEDPRSPERGQYRFVQGLIREVAYARLSRGDRVARHLEVARRLEATGDMELAGVVASHYADAARSDPGNVELAEKARVAIVAAAERALSLHSHNQAIALFERAIDLTADPVAGAHLRLSLARAYEKAGRNAEGVDVLREALGAFEAAGDQKGVMEATTALSALLRWGFRAEEAVDIILPLYLEVPKSEDATWARLASQTSRALMLANRTRESVEVADAGLPIMEMLGLTEEVIETLINKGSSLGKESRWLEGSAILRGVVELATRHDMTSAAVRAINNLASTITGDEQRNTPYVEEMEKLVGRLGNQGWTVWVDYMGAREHYNEGDYAALDRRLASATELTIDGNTADYLEMERLRKECVTNPSGVGPVDELIDLIDTHMSTNDPQLRSYLLEMKAEALLLGGRLPEVVPLVIDMSLAGDAYPFALEVAVVASAWLADAQALDDIRTIVTREFPHGRACEGLIVFIDAIAAAISGDGDAAGRLYAEADEVWRQVMPARRLAVMRAACARVMGLDDPIGRAAGAAAGAFFAESGSLLYLELFAEALPGALPETDGAAETLAG